MSRDRNHEDEIKRLQAKIGELVLGTVGKLGSEVRDARATEYEIERGTTVRDQPVERYEPFGESGSRRNRPGDRNLIPTTDASSPGEMADGLYSKDTDRAILRTAVAGSAQSQL